VARHDVVDDRGELPGDVLVDEVRVVEPDHRHVRGDGHHADLVGVEELGGLGLRRAGHARELGVEAEVVLQRDGREGLVLGLDHHPLLGLDGLVHALVVAPSGQDAPGVLVDDENLAALDDVVLVPLEELLRPDRVVQEGDQGGVQGLVEVVDAEVVLHLLDAGLEHPDGALLLVDLVVLVPPQAQGDAGELAVPLVDVPGGGPGDDEGRACLVDEDGVHLVDDGEVVAALHGLVEGPRHVVAQVVEAELVVGAVGDVRGVLDPALVGTLAVEDAARGETHEPVHAAHQLRLVGGEVVVHRDHVDALALQRVQVGREGGDERLALTGLHLGDVAEVQGGPTHELDVEVALAEGAAGGLTHRGEGLRQQPVEGLPVGQARAERVRLRTDLGVRQRGEARLEGIDLIGEARELPEDPTLAHAQDLVHQ